MQVFEVSIFSKISSLVSSKFCETFLISSVRNFFSFSSATASKYKYFGEWNYEVKIKQADELSNLVVGISHTYAENRSFFPAAAVGFKSVAQLILTRLTTNPKIQSQ